MKRTLEDCRIAIIEYIQKHNTASVEEIEKTLHVNIHRLFGGIEKAFIAANITYPRKRDARLIEKVIIDFKENPLLTIDEVQKKYKFNFYKKFKNVKEFYSSYKLKNFSRHKKRTIKKQTEIITYIKKHPDATQWEINKNCHTHVQEIFNSGILEAYEKANVEYPIFRRKIYGAANKKIRNRSIVFEKTIFKKLEKIGQLEKYVKTRNGIIDAILKIKNRKFAIEIKNYLSKPISKSEISQLIKYMKAINCSDGILICNKKGNKDKIEIDGYKVKVVVPDEINGAVVQSG